MFNSKTSPWTQFCGKDLNIWISKGYLDNCFRYLTITYPVMVLLAIISAFLYGYETKKPSILRLKSQIKIINYRLTFTVLIIALNITQALLLYFSNHHRFLSDYVALGIFIASWSIHGMYLKILKERQTTKGARGYASVNFVVFLVTLCSIYDLICVAKELEDNFASDVKLYHAAFYTGFLACYFITLLPNEPTLGREISFSDEEFLSTIASTSRLNYGSINADFIRSPSPPIEYEKKSLISLLTFWWVFPLLSRGVKGNIEEINDLFQLPDDMKVKNINESFIKNDNILPRRKNELFHKLQKTFGLQFYSLIILKLMTDALSFSGPIFLNLLINFLENKTESISAGVIYATGLSVAALVNAFLSTHFTYRINYVSIKVKTAIIGCVYRKTIDVTSNTLNAFNTGEIVNFMSCDSDRICNYCQSFHQLWSLPVQVIVVLYLLYQQIGLSFLVGLAYALLLIPINRWLANKIGFLSTSRMKAKDDRIKLMNESIAGIRVIKLNAWESVFLNDIRKARVSEMFFLKKRQYLDALCVFFWATTPVIISVATFSLYSTLGNKLTAAKVFTSLTLFGMLVTPLNAFPWVLNGFVEAWVSLQRVQNFLKLENFKTEEYFSQVPEHSENILKFCDAVFTWKDATMKDVFTLGPINFEIAKGHLIGIVGPVGSGKTSLLLSVVGEPYLKSGKICINQTCIDYGVAYVPQEPILAHATLQDNILFGKPMNYLRYNAALKACALLEDLKSLPNGDLTEIGERGISLSGGQKARISLARAIYQDLDLYLLDDPFSAVDVHVGEHIYQSCIKGALKNKAVILCTHHTKFLQEADCVLSLNKGVMTNKGLEELETSSRELDVNKEIDTKNVDEKLPVPIVSKKANQLIENEEKEKGTVKFSVYKSYYTAVGKWISLTVISFLFLMQKKETNFNFYLYIFIATGVMNGVFTLFRAFTFAYGGICAAINFHDKLLTSIINAPIYFFDKTPLGRILNRFSSDLNMVDDTFPFILNIFLDQAFRVLAVILVTCYGIPWMILLFIPLGVAYFHIQNFYRHTSREIKRLTSISLSPIFEHFSETIHGLTTLRAFEKQQRFVNENEDKVEINERALYSGLVVSQWLSLFLQLIGVTVVFGMSSMAIAQHYYSTVDAGQIGLAMSYALTVTSLLSGVVSSFTECEKEIVSVERISQYTRITAEKIHGTLKPQSIWPDKGIVFFENVHLRYHKGYEKALSGVSFATRPSEKLGIVGRTGSGKSSLFQALFRIVELDSGSIKIDGFNIDHLDLHYLRSHLAIVSQDPILFSGSVRKNLDPNSVMQDSALWKVLRQCKISAVIHQLGGLEAELGEKALSLSAGQRQLFCLARVLLSSSKILCFDEATANVDANMDNTIQQIIKEEFKNMTLLIIAHRIETIMSCDRVIVMEEGKVLEIGSPSDLMKTKSHFIKFVKLAKKPSLHDA